MFPTISGARARATLGVTVTDNNHDGAAITGLFPDGKLYRAYYNDMGGPATGTVFASLQSPLADLKQNTSASSTAEFAAAGAFSTTDQSATPLGAVSSMSASIRFQLNPFDCAAVTSVFVINGCGDGNLGAGEECDDGNNVDGDGCSASCEIEGACCSDGPGTQSECFLTTEDDCNTNAKLYIGDGTVCSPNIDCEALLVTMDSMAAVATPGGVLLSWTTATEIDTIGFRVLREEPAQRREKRLAVVADLIPAAGSGLSGATYELFDDSPAAARAMYYYIEDIDIYGRVTRHGPIVVERGARQSAVGRSAPKP